VSQPGQLGVHGKKRPPQAKISAKAKALASKDYDKIRSLSLNEYCAYYTYAVPVNGKELAARLEAITHVQFRDYDDYNKIAENPIFAMPQRSRQAITNPHEGSHHVRAVAENRNMVEFAKTVKVENNTLPARPVLDINSTRILKAGFATVVLTPQTCGADADRARQTQLVIKAYNATYSTFDTFTPIVNYDMLLNDYMANEFDNLELPEFFTKLGVTKSDLLINLTDVIYYLKRKQIYECVRPLNDGTVICGTMHVPRNHDNGIHPIVIAQQEGFVCMNAGKTGHLPAMTMSMFGNDHVYVHDATWADYAQDRLTLIPMPDTGIYPYILKFVVDARYNCGGTDYVRFHIIKISYPNFEDFQTGATQYSLAPGAVSKRSKTFTQHYQVMQNKLSHYRQTHNIPNDINNADTDEYPEYDAYYDQEWDTFIRTYMMATFCEPTPIKYTDVSVDLEDKDVAQEVDQLDQQTPKVQPLDDCLRILSCDGQKPIIYRLKPSYFGIDTQRVLTDTMKYVEYQVAVSDELYNKIVTKILLAQTVDTALIKSIVSLYNRSHPEVSVADTIIPIIAYALLETKRAESLIVQMQASDVVSAINTIKSTTYKRLPQGFIDAFVQGRACEYLAFKLRRLFSLENPEWGFH
jgi:hypothetical protein